MSNIESVLQESRIFPPSEAMVKQANVSGMAAYQALCDEAGRDLSSDAFGATLLTLAGIDSEEHLPGVTPITGALA